LRGPLDGLRTAVTLLAMLIRLLTVALVVLIVQVRSLNVRVDQTPTAQSDGFVSGTDQQLQGVCRLLGALAAERGEAIPPLFDGEVLRRCEERAREGASQQGQGG